MDVANRTDLPWLSWLQRACLRTAVATTLWVLAPALRPTDAPPALQLDPPAWDFGTLTNRPEITREFLVRNAGGADLKITRVISSCSACLSAGVEAKRIPPGESTVLRCRLDLRRLEGTISRTVTITSNDPDRPSLVLPIMGTTIPLFQVTPPEILLDLGTGALSAVAQILPLVQLHAPLAKVQMDNTNMIAQLSSDGANGFALEIRPLPSLPRGRSRFQAILTSGAPADPACLVDGFVSNPPDFEVVPSTLALETKADPQVRLLWIRQRGAEPLSLRDVIPSSEKMRVTVEPDLTGSNYRIEITAWDVIGTNAGPQSLQLKLRDPANHQRIVSVPITVEPPKNE